MAAMAASCSFVAFWTASCCAILSSMVAAKAAAVGAHPVLGASSSDGESGRAMIFADATLSAPWWAPTITVTFGFTGEDITAKYSFPSVQEDILLKYLTFFLEDDAELEHIKKEYGEGRMLAGAVEM
ncbi:hypothetical protein F2Q69_00013266 [Brassica cretica]|uniref:Uncharacterized protein n=1 Tax=Brassica cretica TaxID=69181 RepID=A0A8S9R739_BRACR|nr:hypothetical protein F2Q69_00013266 [Brassica cretica]